jgi:hypothetical protein
VVHAPGRLGPALTERVRWLHLRMHWRTTSLSTLTKMLFAQTLHIMLQETVPTWRATSN